MLLVAASSVYPTDLLQLFLLFRKCVLHWKKEKLMWDHLVLLGCDDLFNKRSTRPIWHAHNFACFHNSLDYFRFRYFSSPTQMDDLMLLPADCSRTLCSRSKRLRCHMEAVMKIQRLKLCCDCCSNKVSLLHCTGVACLFKVTEVFLTYCHLSVQKLANLKPERVTFWPLLLPLTLPKLQIKVTVEWMC